MMFEKVGVAAKKVTKALRYRMAQELIDSVTLWSEFSADQLRMFNELCESNWLGAKRLQNPNPKHRIDKRHIHVFDGDKWFAWSWVKAIQQPNPRTELYSVMRFAVKPCTDGYKSETSETECAWAHISPCKGVLTVDHKDVDFCEIADEFIDLHGEPETVDGPPGCGHVFKDVNLEAEWIAFHQARATYQLLCRSHNASKGARSRRKNATSLPSYNTNA